MRHANIWDALSHRADGIKHAMFFELQLCTGWVGSQQRLDAWSIPLWPSLSREGIAAYEVKTSRSDFLRELKQPDKRVAGIKRCNRFYFVTTEKVVKEESEIPPECGWLLFENGVLKTVREAPEHECEKPDWGTVRAICRRAFDSEVIGMQRKIQTFLDREKSRANRGDFRSLDLLGEWLIEESKGGDLEIFNKIKKTLEPAGHYDWVRYRDKNGNEIEARPEELLDEI